MEFPHPPLKLNTDNTWPSHLHNKKIFGLDVGNEHCSAAIAKRPADGVIPTGLDDFFYDPYSGEYFCRIPTVLALDEDPSRGWIGFEGEHCAENEGRTLYRDFLMVPDQRADRHYQNDPAHPTYRQLMAIFFYEVLDELRGGLCFLALPGDEDWRQQQAFFRDFLQEVAHRWNTRHPDPDRYAQFFLLDPSGADAGHRLNEPEGSAEDPYARCKGLAICGYLLQQREILLNKTREMLEEAFPWAWARFRDVLYKDMQKLFSAPLEKALSRWGTIKEDTLCFEKTLSFRALMKQLSVDTDSVAANHTEQIQDSIRRASLLIVENIPSTGSDPMDDPNAFSGFPPIYLGPKAYFPNQLHHRILTRTHYEFADDLSWLNWEELEEFYFICFMNPAEYCQAIQPFIQSFHNYLPSESAMLGPVYSKTVSLLGSLDNRSPDDGTRDVIYRTTIQRKEQIAKDMQWKIYHDEQSWDILSRLFFQAVYQRQIEVLNHCLSFITVPTPPAPPEEGVLI